VVIEAFGEKRPNRSGTVKIAKGVVRLSMAARSRLVRSSQAKVEHRLGSPLGVRRDMSIELRHRGRRRSKCPLPQLAGRGQILGRLVL
jgi:hypothetical protein